MGALGIIGVMGRMPGTVLGGVYRAAKTGVGAIIASLPYQIVPKTRMMQLEECEATLRVVIAQADQQRTALARQEMMP